MLACLWGFISPGDKVGLEQKVVILRAWDSPRSTSHYRLVRKPAPLPEHHLAPYTNVFLRDWTLVAVQHSGSVGTTVIASTDIP